MNNCKEIAMPLTIDVDHETKALYIEVPRSKVVLLQGIFELYEGLGTLRTVDIKNSLLCILCTKSNYPACIDALNELKDEINWRPAAKSAISIDDYLESYGRKNVKNNT